MWSDKRFRYTPEKIAGRMNSSASTAVEQELDGALFLQPHEVKVIIRLLSTFDPAYYRTVKHSWIWFFKMSRTNGYVLPELDEEGVLMLLHAIEQHGSEREHFELMRETLRWLGIRRESAKLPYSPIPQDNRPGIYDDSYDGTAWYEFVDQTNPLQEEIDALTEEMAEYDIAMCSW